MSLNIRMLPPTVAQYQTIAVFGRTYAGTPGTVKDVPSGDADVLAANGWVRIAEVGTTAQRPVSPPKGKHYADTTLGAIIISDGATWRTISGAAA